MDLIGISVWNTLIKHWGNRPRFIAVAYFSNDENLQFNPNDLLIVNASDAAISSGQTNAAVLQRAVNSGAKVYSCENLHAKIFVLGSEMFIGSANISSNSRNNLIECLVYSKDQNLVSDSIKFIKSLIPLSVPVDSDFLYRILNIEVINNYNNIQINNRQPNQIIPTQCWLIGIRDRNVNPVNQVINDRIAVDINRNQNNQNVNVDWFWWRTAHNSAFANSAEIGDLIVLIIRPDNNNLVNTAVYLHARICDIRNEGMYTIYFYTLPNNAVAIRWNIFVEIATQANIPNNIVPTSCRRLTRVQSNALVALWR